MNKIQRVINDLFAKEAVFQEGHWSSLKNFEQELKKYGFKSPIPLYHDYVFPAGITEAVFENHIMKLIYVFYFSPLRILDPKAYAKSFNLDTNMADDEIVLFLDSMNKITGDLNKQEQNAIIEYFERKKRFVVPEMKRLLVEMKKLNPEIADINIDTESPASMYDLFVGMTSKFHPEDIRYFCTKIDLDDARKRQHQIENIIGFSPNMFIEPSRIDKLVNSIILQKRNMMERGVEK